MMSAQKCNPISVCKDSTDNPCICVMLCLYLFDFKVVYKRIADPESLFLPLELQPLLSCFGKGQTVSGYAENNRPCLIFFTARMQYFTLPYTSWLIPGWFLDSCWTPCSFHPFLPIPRNAGTFPSHSMFSPYREKSLFLFIIYVYCFCLLFMCIVFVYCFCLLF